MNTQIFQRFLLLILKTQECQASLLQLLLNVGEVQSIRTGRNEMIEDKISRCYTPPKVSRKEFSDALRVLWIQYMMFLSSKGLF
jgi:hypothetical protein